ncbi:MAG: transcriptional regulator of the Arc/MetJ class [Planctomycetes bacterium RBG_16_59_8]|nr:MAG: transcriptional regulator of the Arc/MetJ class [Planctomycetes bacterium RBG_16_59_8]
MRRTNVVLDAALVDQARGITGIKTCRAVIDYALHELVRRKRVRDILLLRGAVSWEGDLSSMRRGRTWDDSR